MKENKLWYNTPAKDWNEALPLGNGKLGMMVFGGVNEDRIQLNEETFWSGWECPEYDNPQTYEHLEEMRRLVFEEKYTEAQRLCNQYLVCRGEGHHDNTSAFGSYQTAGDLYFHIPNATERNYKRELILDEGRAVTVCEGSQREYFISYRYNVAVIKIKGNIEEIALRYYRDNATIFHGEHEISAVGYLPTKYAVLIRHEAKGDELFVYITAATAYKTDKDPLQVCVETLDKAMKVGYETLLEDTREYFSSMLNRVGITFPSSGKNANAPTNERILSTDRDLGMVELYFNYGRYLLIASSRGKLPANLQGIWCKDYTPIWSSDFHINVNIQMNYWLAEACDLPELVEPFFSLIKLIAKTGGRTAKTLYGCPGWVAHFTTNAWGYTSLGVNPLFGSFATAGAWCLRQVKERWLYGGDPSVLEEFYPIIKGAAEFFCSYLVEDPRTGYLVTAPASSPENAFLDPTDGTPVNVCAGPTMDTSIVRELFAFAIETAEVLGKDEVFVEKLKGKIGKLTPLRIGKYGQIMEWGEDFEEYDAGHRHISQLYGLYPASEISRLTPTLFEGAKKTIERRLAHGGGHTGWSRAWIINFYARLSNGNAAYENFLPLLHRYTLPNLFDDHPPFQIDGNFGATAGIAEMLLQSHEGIIRVLPALPDEWKDGEFFGLVARGGFKVSAVWRNSKVVRLEVVGKTDKPFTVHYNGQTVHAVNRFKYEE